MGLRTALRNRRRVKNTTLPEALDDLIPEPLLVEPGEVVRRGDIVLYRYLLPDDLSDPGQETVRISVGYLEGILYCRVPLSWFARYSVINRLDEVFRAEARRRGMHRRDGSPV